ncbi:MAG: uracil-DNA glycosylase [Actinomycetes bacterium]
MEAVGDEGSLDSRERSLRRVCDQASRCERCGLSETRTQVVFGSGRADAEVMFIGEAPGADEDRLGTPFVGRSGRLLDGLLAEAGIEREEVFIANVLKCRPPENRDPRPVEIESCSVWLAKQMELVEPRLVCTLGNFATKLLRGDPTGITKVHGTPEIKTVAGRRVRLYPLFHPSAALRSTTTLGLLRADLMRIPDLVGLPLPAPEAPIGGRSPGEVPGRQLGLLDPE